MKKEQQPLITETILGGQAIDMAREIRILKDFLITAAAPKRKSGKYTHTREALQARAEKVLAELEGDWVE